MLNVKDLHVTVDGNEILKGLNIHVQKGEVHAIMGPNGSGKSTLAYVLAGREGYDVSKGKILFEGTDITDLEPDERAMLGIFLGFQYPVEIPGVTTMNFMKTAVNSVRKTRGEDELDAMQFLKLIREKAKALGIREEMLKRSVNTAFSGGEKKRNEILQMSLLDPKLAVLDETDSGLDIDALKTVAEGVNNLRRPDRSIVLITHYQRLLNYIEPDKVHILSQGKVVRTGSKELAVELEKSGYDAVIKGVEAA